MSEKKHSLVRAILIIIGAVFFIWFLLPVFANVKPNIGSNTGMGVFLAVFLY